MGRQCLPTNAGEYLNFSGPVIRITQRKGYCLTPGKVFGETEKQYRVVAEIDGHIITKRVGKSEKVHFERCKYCPPDDT